MHLACSKGYEKTAQAFIENGADIDAVSKRGDSPAIEAAHFNYEDMVDALRRQGANMGHRDKQERTADDWLNLGGVPGLFKKTFSEPKNVQTECDLKKYD